jgi:hypothetical protein
MVAVDVIFGAGSIGAMTAGYLVCAGRRTAVA